MNRPPDLIEVCELGTFMSQHIEHSFSKHFAFEAYETLVEGGSLPDLQNSFTNGSLCKNYVRNFVSFVSVSSPTTSVMKTVRDKRFTFNDQLGTIGGTLGLFTGMSVLSMIEVFFFAIVLVKCIIQELVYIFVNPLSIKSYFMTKKDQKNESENDEQLTCPSHEGCKQKMEGLYVSLLEYLLSFSFIWLSNFIIPVN